MTEATFALFKSLIDIFTIGVVLNFLFRLLRVDYYNPLVKGIIKAVDFPSKILRSFIKPIYSLDLSSFLIALFIQAGAFYLYSSMQSTLDFKHITIFILSFYSVILLILNMAWFIMLGGVILSWVAGDNYHPAVILIRQMADNFFKPFRTFLPPMGGLDFSPIFAFIAITYLRSIFIGCAESTGL